jgi:hypothetical protein
VGVYVNDLVITGTEETEAEAFKAQMKATFQMSDLSLLYFYLGIEVHQDDSGITLRQAHYAKHIVELGSMGGYNPAHTPMEEQLKLSRYSEVEEVDATQYGHLVGSQRYLVQTRPDFTFGVGYVSRFMERPTTEHQQAIKRILRYVAGTLDYGLRYERCPVTSTRARARVALCSSSTTVLSASSPSSSRWLHCQAVKLSTSLPPPPQPKHFGWLTY